ncbi:hypothetical protein ABW21_db0208130 [Orbilia brochopaga]|nr:hypothetical protein ABW21_db0208130 [Drechslerella brochopaga]
MMQRDVLLASSLFLLDDDEQNARRVKRPAVFKFLDQGALSIEQQLVVQKSRTLQGHAQEWASFELADGTKLGHAKLHWKTKYLPVAPSPQSPGSKPTGSKEQFALDLFYYSKDIKYRFAVRVQRAEISKVSENDNQYMLLNLIEATEWDPPKNCGYENQPERPGPWLTLPVTLKLHAKTPESFTNFAAETEVLCGSQNYITWNLTLGQRPQVTADARPRKRSEGLNRLTARLRGSCSPRPAFKNVLFVDAPPASTTTYLSPLNDISPAENAALDGPFVSRDARRESTQSACEDAANTLKMGPFTPQWDRYTINPDPTDHTNTALLATPPKTPILALKRGAPSRSVSPQGGREVKKSRWDVRPPTEAVDSQGSLEEGEIRVIEAAASQLCSASQDAAFLQAKLRTQEILQALAESDPPPSLPAPILPASLPPASASPIDDQEAAAILSTVKDPRSGDVPVKANPMYRFIGAGRNLEEEFGRTLTFEESILVQWLEESDKRLGRTGSMNLDRIIPDTNHVEIEDGLEDVVMQIEEAVPDAVVHMENGGSSGEASMDISPSTSHVSSR